jgi:hypothetical protein
VLLACLCVLTSTSFAGPQEYCALFAKNAANRKTGQSDVTTGTIDNSSSGSQANRARPRVLPEIENWQRAYEQSVTTCIENYGVSKAQAPAKGAPSQAVAPTKIAKSTSQTKVTRHRPAQSRSVRRTQHSVSKAKAKTKASASRRTSRSRSGKGTPQKAKMKTQTQGGDQYRRGQVLSPRGVVKPKSEPQQLMGSSPPVEPKTKQGSSPQSPKCPRSGDPTCGGH